jgi:uncharacterized membrane protein (DUF2068 family)
METAEQQSKLLPWIAGAKLLKAILLFVVAFGFHRLIQGNGGGDNTQAQETFERWVKEIRVDPGGHYAHLVINAVTGMSEHRMHQLQVATILYGMLFATEGTGLMLRKRWAEYLTIVSTTVFLPLEVIELMKPEHRAVKAGLLAFNLLIVAYLVWNVFRIRPVKPVFPVAAAAT